MKIRGFFELKNRTILYISLIIISIFILEKEKKKNENIVKIKQQEITLLTKNS